MLRTEIEDYLRQPDRDNLVERSLGRRLQRAPENDRIEIVTGILDRNVDVGLSLARRSIGRNKHLAMILRRGLSETEGEDIRPWLYCVLGNGSGPMGHNAFFQTLEAYAAVDPSRVEDLMKIMKDNWPSEYDGDGERTYFLLLGKVWQEQRKLGPISEWVASESKRLADEWNAQWNRPQKMERS